MNGAAFLILTGILVNTSLYRMRGKPEDKLFFALILTDYVVDIFCGSILWANDIGVPMSPGIYTFCMTMYFASYGLFCVLWCLYLLYRMGSDEAGVRRALLPVSIPAFIALMIVITNIQTDILYGDKIHVGAVFLTRYRLLTLVPIFVYGIIAVVISFKRIKRVSILIALLFVTHCFCEVVLSCDITPLILTVYLIYAHLFAMRDPFYQEVSGI